LIHYNNSHPDFVFSIEFVLHTDKIRQILRTALTPKIHKAGQTASSTATKNAKELHSGTNEARSPEHSNLSFTKSGAYL